MSSKDSLLQPKNLPLEIGQEAEAWAQSILNEMTLDDKIGQLIHIATWSNRSVDHQQEISELISQYKIGGLIFFQGTPARQAKMTNEFQAISKVPLMISIDGEWGLGMRLEGAEPFPYQMTLGAVQDTNLIREMGKAVARQMKRVGVTLNHAPVVDVNTNAANPVINFRSFGQRKEAVAQRGIAYMEGMQSEHVLACAKHFPGHGDTAADSHKELPLLDKSKSELMQTELYPFIKLIEKGLGAMMIAHLQIPQLDPEANRASTLSENIVSGLLKNELGFNGLVITDALDMRAVADHYAPGKVDAEALLAGNDVLLFVKSVPRAIEEIKKAVAEGKIGENEISNRVYKQLLYKYWMGLNAFKPIILDKIDEDVNQETQALNESLYHASLTLIKKDTSFPIKPNKQKKAIISLYADGDKAEEGSLNHHTLLKGALGEGNVALFEQEIVGYFGQDTSHNVVRHDQIENSRSEVSDRIAEADQVILAIHDVKLKALDNFGITPAIIDFVASILKNKKTHLVFFGNAYALSKLSELSDARSILLAYQENKYTHKYAALAITGEYEPKGKLPVDINETWLAGSGL